MAYAEKYYITYCDPQGNPYRLSLLERDYSGISTQVKGGPIPFSIIIENSSELKVGGVFSTRGVATFVSSKNFGLNELYSSDNQKFKLLHKREDGSSTGYWEGFIIPTGLSEEIDNDVHYITVTASDSLSTLQGIKFLDDNGENYGNSDGNFERSFLFAIKECLKRTGLDLPIRTMVDIKTLLSGEPEQGGVYSVSTAFYAATPSDPRNIVHTQDGSGSILNALEVGMKITVVGGVNDGKILTVESWHRQGAPNYMTSIFVTETVIETTHFNPITLRMVNPPTSPTIVEYEDPLAFTIHDLRTYVNKGGFKEDTERKWLKQKPYYEFIDGTMMCWDVLMSICTLFNVRLFQNQGFWEIRRWNTEALDPGTYSWFEYDSEANPTGRSPFGQDIVFECKPSPSIHMPFGHMMSMDRVLKRVSVRYNFRYKMDGDSLINLIRDGNFANLGTDQNRWMVLSQPQLLAPPGLNVSQETLDLPAGIPTGLRLSGFARSRALTNTMGGYTVEVLKGDKLFLTLWERIDGDATDLAGVYGITLTNIVMGNRGAVNTAESNIYDLVNSSGMRQVSQRESGLPEYYYTDGSWEERNYVESDLLQDRIRFITVYNRLGVGAWRKIDIDLPEMPSSGTLNVEIVGVATLRPTPADRSYTGVPSDSNVVKAFVPKQGMSVRGTGVEYNFELEEIRLVSFRSPSPNLLVTGMFLSKVTSGRELEMDYIGYLYEQDGRYTDSIEDIDILNADEDNDDHVGMIRVLSGSEKVFSDKWDTWAGDFDWDHLGMILAKSIMQNYSEPYRKIDGDFVSPDLNLGSRAFIERTGGAKYAILRGSINYIRNRFSGTLIQIGSGELPDIDREPEWQANGVTRCSKDLDGLNTGMVQVQEVDINPRSLTFMQARWVDTQEDLDFCPIGQANPLFWGAVLEGEMPDIEELQYYPYDKVDDSYRVEYSNDGSGRYLVVYHLASLGNITSILEVENEESISSWEPLPDVQINGITYKGMRMRYVTGTFTGHPKTFIIN